MEGRRPNVQGLSSVGLASRSYRPPRPDYVHNRCPVCGRGDCPEPPVDRVPATWIVLVISLISIPLALGWTAWWLSAGGLDVILRGLEGLW